MIVTSAGEIRRTTGETGRGTVVIGIAIGLVTATKGAAIGIAVAAQEAKEVVHQDIQATEDMGAMAKGLLWQGPMVHLVVPLALLGVVQVRATAAAQIVLAMVLLEVEMVIGTWALHLAAEARDV